MKERYTKHGSAIRIERTGRHTAELRIRESGVAETDDGDVFRCEPIPPNLNLPDDSSADTLAALANEIASIVQPPLVLERMTATEGTACHALEAEGSETRWTERASRVHVSIIDSVRGMRAMLDLGDESAAELDLSPLRRLAAALSCSMPPAPIGADAVVLTPSAAAALWFDHSPPGMNARREQKAPAAWPLDGRGIPIATELPRDASTVFPNTYRPSYRIAPFRLPMHVRVALPRRTRPIPGVSVEAVLSRIRFRRPIEGSGRARHWIEARVLVREGSFAEVRSLRIPNAAVITADPNETWFPILTGTWGSETVIEGVELGSP